MSYVILITIADVYQGNEQEMRGALTNILMSIDVNELGCCPEWGLWLRMLLSVKVHVYASHH